MISFFPFPEQGRFSAEVERRLSVVAELEGTVAANLAYAGARQVVLKPAYERKLWSNMQEMQLADRQRCRGC